MPVCTLRRKPKTWSRTTGTSGDGVFLFRAEGRQFRVAPDERFGVSRWLRSSSCIEVLCQTYPRCAGFQDRGSLFCSHHYCTRSGSEGQHIVPENNPREDKRLILVSLQTHAREMQSNIPVMSQCLLLYSKLPRVPAHSALLEDGGLRGL